MLRNYYPQYPLHRCRSTLIAGEHWHECPSFIRKGGKLLKKSPTLLVGFQNRSVEVGGHQLRYFKETKDRDVVQMGILNFDLYQCKV